MVITENNIAISVKNISKKFKIFYDKGTSLKERILFKNRRRFENRVVLKDVSFEVKKGEAIGFIGHNGCGKSTLLKLLTRIMYPDTGTIEINGRVSSLIELGAGFHPDMSGRENIYTNAAIFGLTRKEIDARLQDIIDFSELEEFIDNPVRTYSSGMYMRLAFSVAINVDADILMIDEILAVGDVAFQNKCFEKLREIKASGTTIIIVSHSLPQIEQICDTCYWIHEGFVKNSGKPKYINELYLSYMDSLRVQTISKATKKNKTIKNSETEKSDISENKVGSNKNDNYLQIPDFCESTAIRIGTQQVRFTYAELTNEANEKTNVFYTNDKMMCTVEYESDEPGLLGNFGFGIFRDDDVHCYGTNINLEYDEYVIIQSHGKIAVKIDLSLLPGKYFFDIAVHSPDGIFYDDIRRIQMFQVFSRDIRDVGVARLHTDWFMNDRMFKRK